MRASSAGLEIEIEISGNELSILRDKLLTGILKFDDTMLNNQGKKRETFL